ncbi:MAG: hypothetical protein M3540_07400 [Actinomycetota bacterium]|nr:hypothetical protein [Actinomycetota bacterium]
MQARSQPVARTALGVLAAAAVLAGAAGGATGGAEAKRPTCDGKKATIVGTARSETINGTGRADVIVAGAGNDGVKGLGGDDRICLGAGNDNADGGPGNDRVFGERGRDLLQGGAGNDRAEGGDGNDIVLGATVRTGGPPTAEASDGNDVLGGGPGNDTLFGGRGANTISGGPGNDGCVNGTGLPEPLPPARSLASRDQAARCEGPPDNIPRVNRVIASFSAPVTTYRIGLWGTERVAPASAEPLPGTGFGTVPDPLCGTFTTVSVDPPTAVATWSHPHPPCPNENVHPGLISFYSYGPKFFAPIGTTQARYYRICVTVRYAAGSAPGIGDAGAWYDLCATNAL